MESVDSFLPPAHSTLHAFVCSFLFLECSAHFSTWMTLSVILQDADQASPPPRSLPNVPVGNPNNITLKKELQVESCQCRALGDRANFGALGVIWGRVLGRLSRKVEPQGSLFMKEEVPAAHATAEAGHHQGSS